LFLKIGLCVSVLPNAGKEDFSDPSERGALFATDPRTASTSITDKTVRMCWHYVISSNSQSSITLAVPVRPPR